MRRFSATWALACLVISGCVVEGGADQGPDFANRTSLPLSGEQTHGPLPADGDLSTPPEAHLTFDEAWNEQSRGTLYTGAEVTLSVAPARFPECGTWGTVVASVLSEAGEVREHVLGEGAPGSHRHGVISLPTTGSGFEVWLRAENADGCVDWDSDYGQNYRFDLHRWEPGLVRFGSDWSETVETPLRAGGALVVDYDWDRLPDCRIVYRGFPGWEILAHVRFDGGEPLPAQAVSRIGSMYDTTVYPLLAVFPIPEDARNVELWFENGQYPPTCHGWDSDYGRNYHFDIR